MLGGALYPSFVFNRSLYCRREAATEKVSERQRHTVSRGHIYPCETDMSTRQEGVRDTSVATSLQIVCARSYSAAFTDLHMISQLTGRLTQPDTHKHTLAHTLQ